MNNEPKKYNLLLYEKMKKHQDAYRDRLLAQPPEEILKHTYEYTIREDILLCFENFDLQESEAKALLSSPSPIDDVYDAFNKMDCPYWDELRSCIEAEAHKRQRDAWKAQRATVR